MSQECAVPDCAARTLRPYCVRCEINGPADDHRREAAAHLAAIVDVSGEALESAERRAA